ncbi:dihydrofolate reductase-like [Panonychus citri]|uniref:dihydrofolate reductase-like n=1 Tax=Panonychus citri TaxID=50023 RepID=UPI0023074317|nr:dihydrofolate reductase-like [Panonychus citri]
MKIRNFSLIAAICDNYGIGVNNKLPWRLKNEMNYFTRITITSDDESKKNAVIMGRKTWESIPEKYRPLDGRINLIVSRTVTEKPIKSDGVFSDLKSALVQASCMDEVDQIFIVGGEQIYREALTFPECSTIYLTRIEANFDCDSFFPKFDEKIFQEISKETVPKEIQEENGLKYKFHVYQRKSIEL